MFQGNAGFKQVHHGQLWRDAASIKAIGGDLRTSQLRWYIDVVTDNSDEGYLKLYVGQAPLGFDMHFAGLSAVSLIAEARLLAKSMFRRLVDRGDASLVDWYTF